MTLHPPSAEAGREDDCVAFDFCWCLVNAVVVVVVVVLEEGWRGGGGGTERRKG